MKNTILSMIKTEKKCKRCKNKLYSTVDGWFCMECQLFENEIEIIHNKGIGEYK